MSRDLSFWKIKKVTQVDNSEIYQELANGKNLDYIGEIPVNQVLEDFKNEFKEWNIQKSLYFEKGDEAFQLMITNQFVRADCYGMTEYNMNRIIDILYKYDCPLYDSTIDVRFDGTD
jgi:hypothetical protein